MSSRAARVLVNGELAGILVKDALGYGFRYSAEYLRKDGNPPVSITLPKREEEYRSDVLFPFFFGLLAEGENKAAQCRVLKIDGRDHLTRLLLTARTDTIGAVTVEEAA